MGLVYNKFCCPSVISKWFRSFTLPYHSLIHMLLGQCT